MRRRSFDALLSHPWRRRDLLAAGAGATLPAWLPPLAAAAEALPQRAIPGSESGIPVVGLGSWITFNVGTDPQLRDECAEVMRTFFDEGGAVIDSSPMYGSSAAVIGYGLDKLSRHEAVFAADKVWTEGDGAAQIDASLSDWRRGRFELLQVHNLVAWQKQLPLLRAMKAAGELGFVGVTTSHGRRHDALEQIMRNEPLDFVQLTYNPVDREAEQRLLPLAAERGIAVIVNRPFRRGALTERLAGTPLPEVAGELEATSWAQLILKFILSHPAVTCPIPATTRVDHVRENLRAARGPLPDARQRETIAAAIRAA